MNYEATPLLKGNILIVDDVPNNLHLLAKILSKQGYKTRTAPDGQLALRSIELTPPDLILLDIMMPDMDGYTVCKTLKASPATKDIPVIFISALNEVLDKVKAFEVGGVDYITKPFHDREVLARVSNQLMQRQLFQQTQSYAQQLEQTLTELKKTQAQLIQKEKMASLGQLVAGIAHEINNPVSFIYGNVQHADDYFKDLLKMLQLYQKEYPKATPVIQQEIDDVDLNFLLKDLPKLLGSMKMGAERIRQIVLSLKNFSRLDESEQKHVDIHEGIDSTLLILQHRFKETAGHPKIMLIKEYGNLPRVQCYAGQLNQVFMNIIGNAIDAVEEAMETGQWADGEQSPIPYCPSPTLRICTEVKYEEDASIQTENIVYNKSNWHPTHIVIRIADNGPGIPAEVHQRLFDPFFTTKEPGKGTGLGLSISYQIVVEKHGGQLHCNSAPGQGTEFAIEIPIGSSS